MELPDPRDVKMTDPEALAAAARPAVAGGVLPRLNAARARLEARDLLGALAIYEEVLAEAGARADVLVTLSGELGAHGYARELIELVAPRYDAHKHGPAAGLNLLQAYLATRDLESAQHLLDLLFALRRPDLEERLLGFSNAIADLMAGHGPAADEPAELKKINMITISKPMWFYGLEAVAPHLLARQEGRLRRVVFAQCSLPGIDHPAERAAQPEDPLARLTRGLPLWFAETFQNSAGYDPVAAIGVTSEKHYMLFPGEWLAENIRQLHETTASGLDYAVTGALRNRHDDFELHLRIWEVKKFRELKSLHARWTPATADAALGQLLDRLRTYMEWKELPAGQGLPYAPPPSPLAYVQALGSALTLFLGEKDLLAAPHVQAGPDDFLPAATEVRGQLALATALPRWRARGTPVDASVVARVRAWLASDEARALGLAEFSP